MSDNKFIKHLKGENTAKSLLEVRNQNTPTSFANMPDGTSNANDVYSDHRGNATGVLKGTENWKLDGQNLVGTTTVYGDGRDFTDSFSVFGNGLWVDATYTFATARRFSPNTKFILKLCGHDLETVINHTVDFTLIVKFGTSNLISKTFTVTEQAFDFCKEFVIDFTESNSSTIKADAGSTMQIQLLCADPAAQAVLYNGMTVFTALQRRVDGDAVASDTKTFEELEAISDAHISNKNNPHEVTKAQVGLGNCDNTSDIDKPISTATQTALDGKVNDTGDTLTGMYKHEYGSRTRYMAANSTAKYTDVFMNGDEFEILFHTSNSIYDGLYGRATNGYVTLYPGTDNQAWLGLGSRRWQSIFVTQLRPDSTNILTLPNGTGVLATKADVDLAANSGSQLYTTGVWYAKMYSASVVPTGAEYDGKNYADFSQVDSDNNPVIKIYTGASGAWTLTETITPPATYNGYITVTSKIWDIAEQTDQQGGEVLWSYNQKTFTPYPKIVSLLNQANTDLSNLTSTGANIGNWSSNVSNCITEIPQDINLELNGGVLTLKAGSKLYKPNGAGVFDTIALQSDVVYNFNGGTGTFFIYNTGDYFLLNDCVSGATDSKAGVAWHIWYDTDNNLVKLYAADGTTPQKTVSFPAAIVTVSSGTVSSINQVFNGIGYIGSTVFALPGVKGLIPDGRNADGTLKSVSFEVSAVRTFGYNLTGEFCVVVGANDMVYVGSAGWKYDASANINTDYGTKKLATKLADVTLNSGVVTSFEPVQAFHAVDYSDLTNILETIYPIGAIYIGTQTTCPMSVAIPGSTWTLVSSGRALWTGNGSNANTTIAAGLPDITGSFGFSGEYRNPGFSTADGAFTAGDSAYGRDSDGGGRNRTKTINFKASSSSSIYGNSTTVQPPAYVVNVWRRTA